MMAGHAGLGARQPIALALGLLAAGTDLFKPPTTALVGALLFDMRINIGAALVGAAWRVSGAALLLWVWIHRGGG